MKIAITAHGNDCQSEVDSRFGRADYFMLYDTEKEIWEAIPNTQNVEAAHGAGIQAGQTLAKSGASILVTGHVGPKAFKVLAAEKISMFSFGDSNGSVEQVLKAMLAGELKSIDIPSGIGAGK
ncbi:MAG: NifB/NifX family molybdenum-iron cluster-binding protein [Negativicutes bacterium]